MSHWLLETIFPTVGLILAFGGAVRLGVRKKTGAWKEGGAAALAGGIIAGVPLLCQQLLDSGAEYDRFLYPLFALLMAGLVFGFDRGVRRCVRNRAGKWKEGGGSLLAGVIISGVSLGVPELFSGMVAYLSFPGLVLVFNGAVQLSVRTKAGAWVEGGASLLVGAIILGATILSWMALDMGELQMWVRGITLNCSIAGLVLAFNGVADLP